MCAVQRTLTCPAVTCSAAAAAALLSLTCMPSSELSETRNAFLSLILVQFARVLQAAAVESTGPPVVMCQLSDELSKRFAAGRLC
jgi:hypothetical protein